ncbi:ATP-binding cassette domain-containing protein [Halobacillus litoralis]|uniref:ATP-binding cassette domain-containing protein n=1 Tax=Halobacillus litoralis TaxID=45668 RepID=A0A845DQE5_9BACI|nr:MULTISPECIES: ABC transporter ATP-binding protein [Halobacillus]MYL19693.1 ATP-binding cassette domain-containing protein [Halobacillus litoralis]MYL28839.1 ATP-binding cassette domain-containing protein [Halobacillus halophilus]MYL37090.1 ATP-binding cassette domain-containing protein [Halobacillus litoralis]
MAIFAEKVTKTYQSGEVTVKALREAGLTVPDNKIVTILGPSGSGKSTLLNVIGGIDRYDEGRIEVDGQALDLLKDRQLTEYRRNKIGFIFQQYNLIPTLTVEENVEVGRELSSDPFPMEDILGKVGMFDKKDKFPFQLSGGEQQRVAVARALIKNPDILLCDEPTGALDEETGKNILKLLKYVNDTYGTTILIITHNQGIGEMAHQVIRMSSGEIVETYENETLVDPEQVTWS